MKNWRTTIIGALMAAVSAIALYQQSGGDLADWKQYVIPALLAALGFATRDANNTLKLAILSCFLLPSCATNGAGQSTFLGLTGADWQIVGEDAGIAGLKASGQQALISYGARRNIEVTATK
jgi:hypothetical protein